MHCCKFTGRCRGYIPFFSLQNFVGSGHQVLESIATNELARYDPQPSQILICGDQPSSSFHSPHALTLTSSSWRCLWTIVQDKWFRIIVILCTALRLSLVLDPKTHRVRKNGFVFLFFLDYTGRRANVLGNLFVMYTNIQNYTTVTMTMRKMKR